MISYNRKWQLARSIKSYKQLGDIDIIIHDNGSDIAEVTDYLKELESGGITVNRFPKITSQIELNKVNESIDKYFSNRPQTNYIVTDPDVELLDGAENTLELYNYLLEKYPDIESVGPMLRIGDIDPDYPLYNNVINRHIEQFWGHEPSIDVYRGEEVAFLKCKIDTTFAMHRAGQAFKRMTNGMRLYGKYSARHLDWYKKNVTDDPYFEKSDSAIAHWGNSKFYKEFKGDKLKYADYFDVRGTNGRIEIVKKRLQR